MPQNCGGVLCEVAHVESVHIAGNVLAAVVSSVIKKHTGVFVRKLFSNRAPLMFAAGETITKENRCLPFFKIFAKKLPVNLQSIEAFNVSAANGVVKKIGHASTLSCFDACQKQRSLFFYIYDSNWWWRVEGANVKSPDGK